MSLMLDKSHFNELTLESAIGREVIKARGYETVGNKEALAALGFADYQQRTPVLLFRYFDIYGNNGHYQLKPVVPRKNADQKPIKYESILGQALIIDYNPIQPLDWLNDVKKRLWIVEGVKKADSHITKLREAGINEPVLCIIGVWGWSREKALNLAFNDLVITGRDIAIIPDGDIWSNDQIKEVMSRFSGHLKRKRAGNVAIVGLPEKNKDGLDDLYGKGFTLAELLTLVDVAQQPALQQAILQQQAQAKPDESKIRDLVIADKPGWVYGLGDI